MLFMIGLGLSGPHDLGSRALNAIRLSKKVIMDQYTSVLPSTLDELKKYVEKDVIIGYREQFENESSSLINFALTENVALLIVGDVFCLEAKKMRCPVKVFHNVSIFNAISSTGLSLYKFGETVSIVYWNCTYQPDSFYDRILNNLSHGLHTLCLMDIKVHEPTKETILSKNPVYQSPKYMLANEAAEIILSVGKNRKCKKVGINTRIVLCARVGTDSEKFISCTLEETVDETIKNAIGGPLHSIVIIGDLDPIEKDIVNLFRV